MLHRRNFCKALAAAPVALASPMLMRSSFADEASSIVIVSQHGLPYLPMMVMDSLQLVQKHAARVGVASMKTEYKSLGGTQSLIDALLSRQMDFGVTGVPSLATLWDKTAGTANEVRALSAVQSMPFMLVTNKPEIKTIKDFTSQDKIAVPAIKVSSQAICLQMAAAKEWATISTPSSTPSRSLARIRTPRSQSLQRPPRSTAITRSRRITITSCDFGCAQRAEILRHARWPRHQRRDAHEQAISRHQSEGEQAVYAALSEAHEFINKKPGDAAQIYIKTTSEKRSNQEEMTKFISDPDNIWTTTPQQTMTFAGFMHKVGTMKRVPSSWKDLYMPECHELAGS